jgi:hypothetical protein
MDFGEAPMHPKVLMSDVLPPRIHEAATDTLATSRDGGNDLIRWPAGTLGSSGPWLRAQLELHGVPVARNSWLARSLAESAEFHRRLRREGPVTFPELGIAFQTMAMIFGFDLLSKSLHAGHDHGVPLEKRHFRSLASGDPLVSRPSSHSCERDKTWEAVIAGIASTFCSRVEFAEPDVVCSFEGKRFGLAVKLPYEPRQLTKSIKKGIKQIGRSRDCDGSLVFVNAVQLLQHDAILRECVLQRFESNSRARAFLETGVATWSDHLEVGKLVDAFRRSELRSSGVCIFFPMVVEVEATLAPCWMLHVPVLSARDGLEYRFACAFQEALNTIAARRGPDDVG